METKQKIVDYERINTELIERSELIKQKARASMQKLKELKKESDHLLHPDEESRPDPKL